MLFRSLIVRDDDHDDHAFVLVTGGPTEYDIRGWMRASEAKQGKYRANYGNYGDAYFVPASDLHPIDRFICEEPT